MKVTEEIRYGGRKNSTGLKLMRGLKIRVGAKDKSRRGRELKAEVGITKVELVLKLGR